jgi:valyl-tRNA synthetase
VDGGREDAARWIAAESAADARRRAAEWFAADDLHKVIIAPDQDVLDTWFSSSLLPLALSRLARGQDDVKRE